MDDWMEFRALLSRLSPFIGIVFGWFLAELSHYLRNYYREKRITKIILVECKKEIDEFKKSIDILKRDMPAKEGNLGVDFAVILQIYLASFQPLILKEFANFITILRVKNEHRGQLLIICKHSIRIHSIAKELVQLYNSPDREYKGMYDNKMKPIEFVRQIIDETLKILEENNALFQRYI